MLRSVLLVWLCLTALVHASVTAAWKVPLNTIIKNPEANPAFKKLEKPPGESAFFQPEDELWDLSGVLEWTKRERVETEDPFEIEAYKTKPLVWAGDWIVWNERSKMVIASGNPVDLRDAEVVIGYQDLPVVIRTRCELVAGEGDEKMRFISLASQNGASVKASSDGMTAKIECESSPRGWSDLRCQLSWPAQGEEGTWNVSTAVTIENGKRTLLARQGQGAGGWQLFGTISMESFDGTPQSETRWIESSRGPKPWDSGPRLLRPVRKPLNNGLHLGVFPVPEDLVERLGHDERELAHVKPPVEVDTWAWMPLVDVKEMLAQDGVGMNAEGSFAGFDLRGVLVVISTAEEVDLVEQLLQSTGEPPRHICDYHVHPSTLSPHSERCW